MLQNSVYQIHLFCSQTIEDMNASGLSTSTLGTTGKTQDSESTELLSQTTKFMNRLKSEIQVQKHQKQINLELHQKRVQNLRKELEYLKETDWKYQPVDK